VKATLFARLPIVGALVYLVGQAQGAPILYTFSGTGSGTLGTNPFANVHFLLSATADTRDVNKVNVLGVLWIPVQSATVQVDGFDTGLFGIGLSLFHSPYYSVPPGPSGSETVGLSLATGPDLLNLAHPAFVGYDLVTDLGPVFVPVPDYQSRLSFNSIPTSIGAMTLTSSLNVTFTAAPVPEPSQIVAFTAGLILMGLVRRIKKVIAFVWRNPPSGLSLIRLPYSDNSSVSM